MDRVLGLLPDSTSAAQSDETAAATEKRDELEFWIAADITYSRARAAWLTRCHQVFLFLAIVAGAAAASDLANANLCGFAAALFAALDALFDPATSAAAHRDIVRALHAEVIKLKRGTPSLDRLQQIKIERRLLEISAGETAPYNALRLLAYNAAVRALGRDPAGIVYVPWERRWTANLIRFEGWQDAKPDRMARLGGWLRAQP